MNSRFPTTRGCRALGVAPHVALVTLAALIGLTASTQDLSRCLEDCVGKGWACADACRHGRSARRSLTVRGRFRPPLALTPTEIPPATTQHRNSPFSQALAGRSQEQSLERAAEGVGITAHKTDGRRPRRRLLQDEGAALASTLLGFDGPAVDTAV